MTVNIETQQTWSLCFHIFIKLRFLFGEFLIYLCELIPLKIKPRNSPILTQSRDIYSKKMHV